MVSFFYCLCVVDVIDSVNRKAFCFKLRFLFVQSLNLLLLPILISTVLAEAIRGIPGGYSEEETWYWRSN